MTYRILPDSGVPVFPAGEGETYLRREEAERLLNELAGKAALADDAARTLMFYTPGDILAVRGWLDSYDALQEGEQQ